MAVDKIGTFMSFFRLTNVRKSSGERIEPRLSVGAGKEALHRRCCCVGSDELPNAPTSKPVRTISLADAGDELRAALLNFSGT